MLLMVLSFSMLVSKMGWRSISAGIALMGIPLAFVFYRKDGPTPSSSKEAPRKTDTSQINMAMFLVARAMRWGGIFAIVSFVPLFAVDVLDLGIERAALFSGMIFLGGALGALIAGWLCDRYQSLIIMTLLNVILIPLVLLLTFPGSWLTVIFLLVGLGMGHLGFYPPNSVWLSEASRGGVRGKIFGAGEVADGITSVVTPGLLGFLADRWGLVVAFRWMLVPLVLATLLTMLLLRSRSHAHQVGYIRN